MNWKKKPKEQLTMFPCPKCGNRLNTTEFYMNRNCARCIAQEKGVEMQAYNAKETKKRDSAVSELLSKWVNDDSVILLDYIPSLNYLAKNYSIYINAGKDLIPMVTIHNEYNAIIYANSTGTTEGIEVFNYLKEIEIKKLDGNAVKRFKNIV